MTDNHHDPASHPDVGQELEHTLGTLGIPPCPALLTQVCNEIRKEEPDFAHLESIISADVAVSASLVKIANSPFFSRPRRARSVSDALNILGLSVISYAIAGIVLRRAFPESPAMIRFWDSSARVARISGWLAQKLDIRGLLPEEAYTYGLFRDCGIPVLFLHYPDYVHILEEANHDAVREFTAIESARLPTHHAQVGSELAEKWWLPEDIYLAIRAHHHLPALADADSLLPLLSRQLIATAQLAEHLLQRQLGLSYTSEWPKLGAACCALLHLDEDDLAFLYREAHDVAAAEA